MIDLSGKVVLVTGGTSGLGQAIARGFHAANATVIAAGLRGTASGTEPYREEELEVTDSKSVDALFAELDGLHVLVNAAGIIRRDAEFSIDQFQLVLDVNLTGVMRVCMSALPHLKKSGGCVINIASMYSIFGAARAPGYSASKGAVVQLTRSLAAAWAAEAEPSSPWTPATIQSESWTTE